MAGETQALDIYPLGKGRRILCFLGDFFVNLIFAIFIFSFVVMPVSKAASGYNAISQEASDEQNQQLDVLYDGNLLFSADSTQYDYDLSADLKVTCQSLIGYSIGRDGYGSDSNVFYVYYVADCQLTSADLSGLYGSNGSSGTFFDFSSSDGLGLPVLKEPFRTEFAPLFDSADELSSEAEDDYSEFTDSFFLPFYKTIIEDLSDRASLPEELLKYRTLGQDIREQTAYLDRVVIIAAYVSYFLSFSVLFVLLPLNDSRGRGLTMRIMKADRIDRKSMRLLDRRKRLIQILPAAVFNSLGLFMVPYPFLTINYLFNLPALYIVSLFSAACLLGSFIYLLTDRLNLTLADRLTDTVMIDSASLDDIYKAKGYMPQ